MTTFTIKYGTERHTYHVPTFMAESMRSQYKFKRGLDIKYPKGFSARDSRRANRDAVAHHLLVAMSTFGAHWAQEALVPAC